MSTLNPNIAVGRSRQWRKAERVLPGKPIRVVDALVRTRSEALQGARNERYVWFVLALSAFSALVLSLWM